MKITKNRLKQIIKEELRAMYVAEGRGIDMDDPNLGMQTSSGPALEEDYHIMDMVLEFLSDGPLDEKEVHRQLEDMGYHPDDFLVNIEHLIRGNGKVVRRRGKLELS